MRILNNITKFLICSFLLLHFAFPSDAQEAKNPFDLNHRIEDKKEQGTEKYNNSEENPFDISDRKAVISTTQSSLPEIEKSDNPFDVNTSHEKIPATDKNLSESSTPIKKNNASKEEASGFIFWVMLLLMVFLALEITLFSSLINKVYRAFTNDNILKLLHREQRNIIALPYLLLYIFFFVSFGIFTFLAFNYFGFVPKSLNILLYCISGIGVLFFLKHLLLKIVEIIFPVQKEIKQYSFSLVIFSSILGFALVPFNIILAFAGSGFAKAALYGGLIAIFGIAVFCILRGLFLASKYVSFHKFHFFMYLCTVEIAPVLVLLKIFLLNTGIH